MITHGLGTRPVNIEVVDDNYNVIIPESIQFIDGNNVKIVFTSSQAGYAAITYGQGSSGTSGSAGTSGSSGKCGTAGSSGDDGY